jgi:hypothetical protein
MSKQSTTIAFSALKPGDQFTRADDSDGRYVKIKAIRIMSLVWVNTCTGVRNAADLKTGQTTSIDENEDVVKITQ